MAHHNSTPKPILDAPKHTPKWIVHHTGRNRQQRRHLTLPLTGRVVTIPKPFRAPATNTTLVRRWATAQINVYAEAA